MEELLKVLHEINASSILPNSEDAVLNHSEKGVVLIRKAEQLAEEVLIDGKGKNVWSAHTLLEEYGFPVRPGETDTWGWLSGVIQTKKGILIYG
jgi:hypothetical protein